MSADDGLMTVVNCRDIHERANDAIAKGFEGVYRRLDESEKRREDFLIKTSREIQSLVTQMEESAKERDALNTLTRDHATRLVRVEQQQVADWIPHQSRSTDGKPSGKVLVIPWVWAVAIVATIAATAGAIGLGHYLAPAPTVTTTHTTQDTSTPAKP